MTTRRLNYTGRRRIRRSDVEISVDDDASMPPTVTVNHLLEEYEFPHDARIVVEAQAHWTLMRFECGTIEAPATEVPLALTDFGSPEGILFRLKVIGVGPNAGLILGEADGVRPVKSEGREEARSFLAVQPTDLGQVTWRLSFVGSEPLLQVNDKIADWRSMMRRPEVRALLMPELYRQLLREAQRNQPDVEARDAWQFAVLDMVPPAAGPRPPADDDQALETWLDEAVRLFAAKHSLFKGLAAWMGGDQ